MRNPLTVTCKMELCSLQPSFSTLTKLPSSLPRSNLAQRSRLFGHFDKLFNQKKYPGCRKLQFSQIRAQLSSGVTRFSSSTVDATRENVDSKDEDTVFVAGATGKVGSRTVRELLKLGFRVRAGVRSAQRAESLIQSIREMKLDTEITSGLKPIENLEIVECDLEKHDQIVPALGRASVVVCCIGASEKEIFDVTGPYRIDYKATANLIDAASVAKVGHFILLTSLGTNKIGFPAAILNLFWGVLIWKRKAEEALIASGLPYTIVRPGGMERPTDSYKETHNVTLSQEDTLFGGQVSNLQVAELMAFMVQNRNLSYCKIVEVVAETTAPLTPMGDLLVKIPSKRELVYKAEEPDAIIEPLDPEPAKTSIYEVATDVAGAETVEEISVAAKPLSPYTAVSGTDADISEATTVKLEKTRPLSPYAVYEDLKPPSSPSPSPPGNSRHESLETSKAVDGVLKVIDGTLAENDPRELAFYHSPFPVYDDLRPPTSPTPTAPNSDAKSMTLAGSESQMTSNPTDAEIEPVKAQNTVDEQISIVPKPNPLSPYTMYDDMKPPSSPMPSPRDR